MRIRHRNRLLLGLGALLGLWTTGCHTPPLDALRETKIYRIVARKHDRPRTPAAELMEPQLIPDRLADARPIEGPAASIDAPIVRTAHEDEEVETVGGGSEVGNSMRRVPRNPEAIDPASLNLTAPPQTRVNYSPYRPQPAEQLHLPRKVEKPWYSHFSKREPVVQATQKSLPTKVVSKGAPAIHPHVGHGHAHGHHGYAEGNAPHEGALIPQPPYLISPPDSLLIRMIRPRTVPDEVPQIIDGEHLVRPDGTVGIGVYGSVYVAGLTVDQARQAIAELIARIIDYKELKEGENKDLPKALKDQKRIELVLRELVVDVVAYRSKFYYVIADGGGPGEQVVPILITGNDTVLDAVGKVGGLPPQSAKKKIWVARSHDLRHHKHDMLPVNWREITMLGQQATNYQLFPGDRLYINSDPTLRAFTRIDRTLDLPDRVFGSIILGSSAVRSLSGNGLGNNRNN